MLLKYCAYAFVLIIYGIFAWYGKASVDSYIAVLGGVISALGASHVHAAATNAAHAVKKQDAPDPAPRPAPTTVTQGGFVNPFLLMTVSVVLVGMFYLTGCASVTQAVSAYSTSGIVAAQAAEDLNIKLWVSNACATPLSAVTRHPEIKEGLKALCPGAFDVLNQMQTPATGATK